MAQPIPIINEDILVLAEHDNQSLKISTRNTIGAAKQLPGKITVLVVGFKCQQVAEAVSHLQGVSKVWIIDAPSFQHSLAENVAALMAEIGRSFAYLLAPATTYGKNIMPRVAALLDVGQISDITQILSPDTFVRPMYAGGVLATLQSLDPIKILTVRPTQFEAVSILENLTSPTEIKYAPIEQLSQSIDLKLSTCMLSQSSVSVRPELSYARVVVAGGRGLQNADNFKLLEKIAAHLNAALGASRAAVDAGFVTNYCQIGQTGKVVAPELYIAVGISGAIQHLAGMKDSKFIVAINKDADAPIFQIADYGLVGDLFTILPDLEQKLAIRIEKSQVE